MNETTELRDRQSQHAERLIRLETLIEQNQDRLNRYEESQRAFVSRYEEGQRESAKLAKMDCHPYVRELDYAYGGYFVEIVVNPFPDLSRIPLSYPNHGFRGNRAYTYCLSYVSSSA